MSSSRVSGLLRIIPLPLGIVAGASLLALTDVAGPSLAGWFSYLGAGAISGLILALSWRWLTHAEAPPWLMKALITALLLRLALGVFFAWALPVIGYDTPTQRSGYSYYDAQVRDEAARNLAYSDDPLMTAFTGENRTDQYGGLLYLSAWTYRYLSPDQHRPLLVVVFSASVSALGVLVIWAFSAQTFGSRSARVATWMAVLFPDAVLLGSSQMREAFIITAIALAFYGYARLRRGRVLEGLAAILLGVGAVALPLSPPYALTGLVVVAGAWLWEGRVSWGRSKRIALLLVPIALLSAFFVIQSWSRIGGLTGSGIEVILNWWRSAGAQWSQNRLWSQSDWTRRLLSSIPSWAVLPFFTTYGLIRPFLPAGIIDSGIPLWRTIAIWRGLGWFAMLPFLLYAPFAAIKQRGWRSLETYLALLVWITAIAASYRGTGDQWDNPRYRAVFLLPQVALAGWVWVEARQGDSPWFNRLVGLVALTTGLFTLWYARRYAWAPQVSVLQAITVIAAITLLTVLAMLLYDFVRARRSGA